MWVGTWPSAAPMRQGEPSPSADVHVRVCVCVCGSRGGGSPVPAQMWRQYSNNVAQLSVGQRLDRGRGRAANVPRDRPDDIGDRLPRKQTNKQTNKQTRKQPAEIIDDPRNANKQANAATVRAGVAPCARSTPATSSSCQTVPPPMARSSATQSARAAAHSPR
jgi:hypothetical protein